MTGEGEAALLRALEEAAAAARDIDELAVIVTAFPDVHSVEVQAALVKTHPPLRELIVRLPRRTVVVDVAVHPDQSLTIRGLHNGPGRDAADDSGQQGT